MKILQKLTIIYQFTFYRIYRFGLTINSPFRRINRKYNVERSVAIWTAMMLSIINWLNFSTLLYFIFNLKEFLYKNKLIDFFILSILIIINCFYFIRKEKYLKIAEKFSNGSFMSKLLGSLYLMIIIFISFYCYFKV